MKSQFHIHRLIYITKTILSTQTRRYLPGAGVVVGTAVVASSQTQIQYLTQIKVCKFWHVQYRLISGFYQTIT